MFSGNIVVAEHEMIYDNVQHVLHISYRSMSRKTSVYNADVITIEGDDSSDEIFISRQYMTTISMMLTDNSYTTAPTQRSKTSLSIQGRYVANILAVDIMESPTFAYTDSDEIIWNTFSPTGTVNGFHCGFQYNGTLSECADEIPVKERSGYTCSVVKFKDGNTHQVKLIVRDPAFQTLQEAILIRQVIYRKKPELIISNTAPILIFRSDIREGKGDTRTDLECIMYKLMMKLEINGSRVYSRLITDNNTFTVIDKDNNDVSGAVLSMTGVEDMNEIVDWESNFINLTLLDTLFTKHRFTDILDPVRFVIMGDIEPTLIGKSLIVGPVSDDQYIDPGVILAGSDFDVQLRTIGDDKVNLNNPGIYPIRYEAFRDGNVYAHIYRVVCVVDELLDIQITPHIDV